MKNNKGVTLIALVITIIVLIILSGVSVKMAIGEKNSLLKEAETAKQKVEKDSNSSKEFLEKYDQESKNNEYTQIEVEQHTVNFYSGTTLLASVKVEDGMDARYPIGAKEPIKSADASGVYVFNGKWSQMDGEDIIDDLNNITSDKNVYAMYDLKKIITFTICNKEFYAEAGMTFEEWVNNSTYNTCNAIVLEDFSAIWIPIDEWNKAYINCLEASHSSGGCFLNYEGTPVLTEEILENVQLSISCNRPE